MAGRFCTLATGGKTVNVPLPGVYEGPGPEEPLLLCPAGQSPSRRQTRPEAVACLCRDGRPVCRACLQADNVRRALGLPRGIPVPAVTV